MLSKLRSELRTTEVAGACRASQQLPRKRAGGLCGSLALSVDKGSAGHRSGKPQKQLERENSFSVSLALMEDALPEKLVVSSPLSP